MLLSIRYYATDDGGAQFETIIDVSSWHVTGEPGRRQLHCIPSPGSFVPPDTRIISVEPVYPHGGLHG